MSINMQKNYSSRFMELSLSLAEQAFKENEVPVGAIITKDNKVISTAIWAITLFSFLTPLLSNIIIAPTKVGINAVIEGVSEER